MIRLKQIDFYGQVSLFAVFMALAAIVSRDFILFAYFAIGAWQLTSAIIHLANKGRLLRTVGRLGYEYMLAFVFLFGLLCLVIQDLMAVYLYLMLIQGIVMAVWYAIVTYKEMKVWEARAFVHLK